MKASFCPKAGPAEVLKYIDVEKPLPKANEVLVKVYASSVTRGDTKLRQIPRIIIIPLGLIFGFRAMKITGIEFAGIVEETGSEVHLFKTGDKVFGTTTGLKFGGNAEYLCVPEKRKTGVITKIPEEISFAQAAVIQVGRMTALQFFKKARLQKGQHVLIFGASGSVGTFAIQIAKHYQAQVTAVSGPKNLDLLKSLGADHVMDYTKEDFSQAGLSYDIIFDAVGKITKSGCRQVLKNDGKYILVKHLTSEKDEYMSDLVELIKKDQIKPVIDRHFKLEQIVEAHKYVETGHKKGNVVIEIVDH